MNFFNFGPLEIVFILIIMIIALGPKKMVETAQSLGKFMRKIVKSPLWHTVMDTSRELRDLPSKLVREAGLEEDLSELKKTKDSLTKLGNISITDQPSHKENSEKTKPEAENHSEDGDQKSEKVEDPVTTPEKVAEESNDLTEIKEKEDKPESTSEVDQEKV